MEFKVIKLALLAPNPDNPRKTFDEGAVAELAASIKEKGVLQPILVRMVRRPLASGPLYQVVCGERRYRAAILAGITEIPATIRDLSDEEALELMLMENFQRQDVHPMEEAAGFAALQRMNRMTVTQIADRVGKSRQYVADRIKLDRLIQPLKTAFYEGKFNLSTAAQVAAMPEEAQQEWMDEQPGWRGDWSEADVLKTLNTNLETAKFDITDQHLIPQRGSCIGCEFNTATSDLFPELGGASRCLNKPCFMKKAHEGAMRILRRAAADGVTIIFDRWEDDGNIARIMQSNGIEYILNDNAVLTESAPDREFHMEDFDCDWEEHGGYDTEEEFNEAKAEAEAEFRKEVEQYEAALRGENGYAKGIMFNKNFGIEEVVFKLRAPSASSAANTSKQREVKVSEVVAKAEAGESTLLEVDMAITAAEQEIEAVKALATENVFKAAKDIAGRSEHHKAHWMFGLVGHFERWEVRSVLYGIAESLGWYERRDFLGQLLKENPEIVSDNEDRVGTIGADEFVAICEKAVEQDVFTVQQLVNAWARYNAHCRIKFTNGMRQQNSGPAAQAYIAHVVGWIADEMSDAQAAIEAKYAKKLTKLQEQIDTLKAQQSAPKTKKK